MKYKRDIKKYKLQTGGGGDGGDGGILYKINQILDKGEKIFENVLSNPAWEKLENTLLTKHTIDPLLYLGWKAWMCVFIIFATVITILSKVLPEEAKEFLSLLVNKEILHVAYSLCRVINICFIIFAVVMAAVKVSAKIGNAASVPYPVLMVAYLTAVLPYAYDLLSLVTISSIILIFYTFSCGGNKPNSWALVDRVLYIMIMVGVIGLAWTFVKYIICKLLYNQDDNPCDSQLGTTTILMSTTFLIYYFIMTIIESIISYNASYWAGLVSKNTDSNSGGDCVSTAVDPGCDTQVNTALNTFINAFLSIIIGVLLIVMFVIGVVPYPTLWTVGKKGRTMACKITLWLINIIINPSNIKKN